jgi:hypothetical protein
MSVSWRVMSVEIQQQNESAKPEIAPPVEPKKSGWARGGKRPGSGRKPNIAKRLLAGAKPATAAEALAGIDVRAVVHDLLRNGSRSVKLQTLKVLWDRIYGKPKQDVSVSGAMVHAHVRDPFLATLPKEALEELARSYDNVLTKYVPQDGPHNQIESKPDTIDSEVVSDKGTNE